MKKIFLVFATMMMSAFLAFAQDAETAASVYNTGVEAYGNGELEQALEAFKKAYTLAQDSADDADIVAQCKNLIPTIAYSLVVKNYNNSAYKDCVEQLPEVIATAKELGNDETAAKAENLLKEATYNYAKELEDSDLALARETLHQLEELGDVDRAKSRLAHIAIKEATEAQKEAAAAKADPAKKKAAYEKMYGFAQEALSYEESAKAVKLLAASARGLEKWDEALEKYQKYLELSPDAKDAENIKKIITSLEAKVKK